MLSGEKVYKKECFDKQRHYSEQHARDHMDALRRKRDCIDPDRLHVYECRFAPLGERHWHVGHFKKAG